MHEQYVSKKLSLQIFVMKIFSDIGWPRHGTLIVWLTGNPQIICYLFCSTAYRQILP